MKVQCTLIIGTFRGMTAASPWIPALSKSLGQTQPIITRPISAFATISPNTFAYSTSRWERAKGAFNRLMKGGSEYDNNDEDESCGKNVSSDTAKGNSEHGHDERSRAFPKLSCGKNVSSDTAKGNSEHRHDERSRAFPKFCISRLENVPLFSSRVDFTGMIGGPIEFKFTNTGKASARTSLAVKNSPGEEPMWFHLLFWNELAETAVVHLKKFDIVRVSGFLKAQALAGEDGQQQIFYQVITQRLNLIQTEAPTFSQQVDVKRNTPSPSVSQHAVVNENTWSPVVSQSTFTDRDTHFQYQQSPVMPSSSGHNTGTTATIIESLWSMFFANPDDWWDNRWDKSTNKANPRCPDFKHKVTAAGVWIDSSPSWVKRELAVWDSRMKNPKI